MNKGFIRQVLKLFESEGIVLEVGERLKEKYKIIIKDSKKINEIIDLKLGEGEVPSETKEHFEKFGFEELVSAVAKQINYKGVLVKEFNIDRLYLGRYIDFLEKAKLYTSWRKADNALAVAEAIAMKKQLKKAKK